MRERENVNLTGTAVNVIYDVMQSGICDDICMFFMSLSATEIKMDRVKRIWYL